MKKIIIVVFILVFVSLVFTGCTTTQSNNPTNNQNTNNTTNSTREIAPDFSWKDANGKVVKLSDLKGKVVLIDFWATWCGPCRMTIPHVEAIYEKYKGKGVEVLGVNLDQGNIEKVQQFIKDYGMKYLIIADPNSKVGSLYGVNSIPRFFIVDKNGRIAKVIVGYQDNLGDVISKEIDALLKE
ncbi:MAG: TlpA family protein disulfide reductase [Caldisericaceae bacterium]